MSIQVGYPESINLPVYPNYGQFKYLGTPFIIRMCILESTAFYSSIPVSDNKINQTEKEQE